MLGGNIIVGFVMESNMFLALQSTYATFICKNFIASSEASVILVKSEAEFSLASFLPPSLPPSYGGLGLQPV